MLEFSQVLCNVFEVISVGRRNLVRSVPTELNKDHNEILELARFFSFSFPYLKISSFSKNKCRMFYWNSWFCFKDLWLLLKLKYHPLQWVLIFKASFFFSPHHCTYVYTNIKAPPAPAFYLYLLSVCCLAGANGSVRCNYDRKCSARDGRDWLLLLNLS